MKHYIIAATVSVLAFQSPAWAASEDLGKRIEALEKEIQLLKHKQEVQEEKDAAAAAEEKSANVELGKSGLKIASPDGNYALSLKGYFQIDGRSFINDDNNTGKNDILARRLRPTLELKAGDASFRLMPDFSGSTTRIFDAHADYKLYDALQFRVGKFKTPIGLERLQSASDIAFIERGHPANLVPNRDVGLMAYGFPIPDVLEYQLGVFNGNADLANTDGDDDDNKDVAARIFVQPFHNSNTVALQGLGVGVGGSIGDRAGSTSKPILGAYKTPGQQDFFKYRSDVFADGEHWRLYPQAYWYYGPLGVLAEYAISHQEVTRGAVHDELQHNAWQLETSYVLTGEDASFKGGVKPANPFNLQNGGFGAWEVAARVGATNVDNDTFVTFADANAAASKAQSYGVGVNWYMNENLKLAADYDFTEFDGGASGGQDRPDEQALFTRVQFRF